MQFEPLWWPRARELRAKGLSCGQIARLVGKGETAVLFAVDETFRERKRAVSRARICGPRRPRSGEQKIRASTVKAARLEAKATGQHVDEVLIAWGTHPRRSTGDAWESVGSAVNRALSKMAHGQPLEGEGA